MPKESCELERALGRLLTAIQGEEIRAANAKEWRETHAALERAEALYWAAKRATLEYTLGALSVRTYLGVDWLARHPRALPAIQEIEAQRQDFAAQA